MRILHILHQFLPDHVGGTEHHVRSLATAQQHVGHEVSIFCRRDGQGRALDRETNSGLNIYRATNGPFTPARRFASTLHDSFLADSLVRVATEAKPEVIHIHHLMGLPAGALRRLASASARTDGPTPLVATLHDYWWVCANAQLITDYSQEVCAGPRWWANCGRCGLARAGLGAAFPLGPLVAPVFAIRAGALGSLISEIEAWIAPTAFVREWHLAHGWSAEQVHVVGHGIEPPPSWVARQGASHSSVKAEGEGGGQEPERSAQGSDRVRPDGGTGARSFAYIGGLAPQKGVHILVEAFNELPAPARLTIAGDESAFPGYVQGLRSRARHRGIRFAGRLDREAVWRTLASTDVLVIPSLWYETASLIVQEAFAAGLPVVAACHGALAERVHHEVDGLLVPPGDAAALRVALCRLMNDPGLLLGLRRGIREVATIEAQARQVEVVYRWVLDRVRRQ